MNKAPFYAELLARMELRYFISGVISATSEEYACIGVQRAVRHGHAERTEIDLMERLLPHVRLAFDVGRRLERAGEASRSLEQAFDWIIDGVAFVSVGGAVSYANTALRALARQNDVVVLRNGRIEFIAAAARAQCDAAVGAVRRLRSGERHLQAPVDFPILRGSGHPPYLVSVRPLGRDPRESPAASRSRCRSACPR